MSKEHYFNSRELKCFLDMDGVLVDFMRGAHAFHNLPYSEGRDYPYPPGWKIIRYTGLTQEEFWSPLGREFWANLKWTPEGKQIMYLCRNFFDPGDVCLLTSHCRTDGCAQGKIDWVEREIPEYNNQLLIGRAKTFCASPSSILIDDRQANVKDFREAGGTAILIPRPWNVLKGIDVISHLTYRLKKMMKTLKV